MDSTIEHPSGPKASRGGSKAPRHRLTFPNLLNPRDLGGYATVDGGLTRTHSLLRTDDLWKLTPQGVQELLGYGVKAVIDLRWPHELAARPSVFQRGVDGVRYTNVSLLDGTEAAWVAKSPGVPKERWNCTVLDLCQPEMALALRTVADAPDGTVLFHCAAGKDRTGVIASMLLAVADVEPGEIAEDYAISSDYIREAYLAAHPPERWPAVLEDVRCPPEQVYNMLEHLESRYGGVMAYLRRIGLSEGEIDRMRSRLRS